MLSYSITGSGKDVLLIHGFGEDGYVWKEIVNAHEHKYRFIVPDLPGCGRSAGLSTASATMESLSNEISLILEKENISKCVMMGHSMGGYICLAFAEFFTEKLAGLGLIHSTAYADSAEKIETRKKGISFILENGAKAFLKTSIPGLFFEPEKNKEIIEEMLSNAGIQKKETLVDYYQAMIRRPDRSHVLKNLKIPLLIVAGMHDKAVPFQQALEQSYFSEKTEFHVLRKSSHMGMFEEIEKLTDIFGSFLASPLFGRKGQQPFFD